MAYLDQSNSAGSRIAAIAGVAAVHAAIGLGVVVGLTVAGVAPPLDTWDPFTITPDPKTTPPPPEPKVEPSAQPSHTVVTPVPRIDMKREDPTVQTKLPDNLFNYPESGDGPNILPTPTPMPTPTVPPRLARPSNERSGWISNDDYPAGPLRNRLQGTVDYKLIIGTNGRVSACDVTRSSGSGQLDDATCRLIQRRARFEPATDDTGAKVVGSFSGTVRWQIPD
ncbi:MAG: energy transducer TonB [Porphyrobacter sp.]|nr:energy transducer TonB [Porphyrobacter sp.]